MGSPGRINRPVLPRTIYHRASRPCNSDNLIASKGIVKTIFSRFLFVVMPKIFLDNRGAP